MSQIPEKKRCKDSANKIKRKLTRLAFYQQNMPYREAIEKGETITAKGQ